MSKNQQQVTDKIKEFARDNSLANSTTNSKTNLSSAKISEIPFEKVTLPLNHFGNNTIKAKIAMQ